MRKLQRIILTIVGALLALSGLMIVVGGSPVARASGSVVAPCTDAGLTTALTGGGLVTFNCGGPATITMTAKTIANSTTIDGSNNGDPLTLTAASGVRILSINSGVTLTLNNLTIANLNYGSGYPIYNNNGALVISGVNFISNTYGVIQDTCTNPCNARLTITNSQFIGNVGGHIIDNGNNAGVMTLSNSSFISNSGEVIYSYAGWKVTIDGSHFISNAGGNVDVLYASNATLIVSNSEFRGNLGGTGSLSGSPIWIRSGGVLTLTSSSFVSNTTYEGSGLSNDTATIYVSNTTFNLNNSTGNSGAIYENYPVYAQILSSTFQSNAGGGININSGANPLIIGDSQFISNTAACTSGAINAGTITVTHSSFISNVSSGACNAHAGALDASNDAYITGSLFLNNQGTSTGGLYLTSGTSTYRNDTVANTVIKGNIGQGQWGGGLGSTENLTVTDSEISGNILQSSNSGGGLYYWSSAGQLTIARSLIANNMVTGTSGTGGGLYVRSANAALVNSTIYSNSAIYGGGVYDYSGPLALTNDTILSNTSTAPGYGRNLHNANVTYRVALRNTAIGGSTINCAGPITSLGHNLSSDATCALTGTLDLTNTNPLLDSFADNGGPTYSFMPLPASPTVNAGDNVNCPVDDQRGVGRPIGPACDIGSIESPYLTPQTITFNALPDRLVTDPAFAITATASSNLGVAFDASGVCAVNGITVTLSGIAGSCTITATQGGDSNFAPATPVARGFNVNLLTQTITFNALQNKVVGDAPFTITATASSNLSVTFASQTNGVCDATGAQVTLLNGGLCIIRASQPGNATYAPAPDVDRSFTVLLTQTITFAALPTHVLGDAAFTISPTASSGLNVTVTSQTLSVCSINSNTVTLLSGGLCTLRASQSGDATYAPAPNVDRSFTVLLTQTITFAALPDRLVTDPAFAITATASSNLGVAFDASGVCAVNGITVTLSGIAGSCTITATQGGDANFAPAAPVARSFNVNLLTQTITFDPLPNKIIGDAAFPISATASSGLSVTFASQTNSTCSISGNLVTLLNGGTCTIRAAQSGNATYAPAPDVDRSFTVLLTQTITFAALPTHVLGDAPFSINASASSGLNVTFASQTLSVCSINSNTVTLLSGGLCTLRASQSGDATYAPALDVDRSFTILFTQTITFAALPDRLITAPPFAITATASSNLPVAFNASGVCAVNGITVTLSGVIGTCTITATQTGNPTYAPASPVVRSFTVAPQLSQTITFDALPDRLITAPPFAITATASSNLPVAFNANGVCAVNGITVTLSGVIGTCTITATQTGNPTYAPASPVARTFSVAPQLSQTIAFGALSDKIVGDAPFTISATATSGLSVTFASQTVSVCAVSGNTVTLISGGLCTLRASQSGNATYAPAPKVDQSFTVFFTQTITFAAIADHRITDAAFAVAPTASSGLRVTVMSLTPSVCTINNNLVSLVTAGLCTLRASQSGNATYAIAPNVERSFNIKLVTLYLPLVLR